MNDNNDRDNPPIERREPVLASERPGFLGSVWRRGSAIRAPEVSAGAATTIGDEVIGLRPWGTERLHLLPAPLVSSARSWWIGSSGMCSVRLMDPSVGPVHAELVYERSQWWIHGAPGAELRCNGVRRSAFELTAGVEVGVGSMTLLAESRRSRALRDFCARILGWGTDRLPVVDQALRTIRLAMAHGVPLCLQGDGDLTRIAEALHFRMLGPAARFIACNPRRQPTDRASVRSPASCATAEAAVAAAIGGSICVRQLRAAADLQELLPRMLAPHSPVMLIVCIERSCRIATLTGPLPILIPPLADRTVELPRIIREYADDAVAALKTPGAPLTEAECQWVAEHAAHTLPEIDVATRRLTAFRAAGRIGTAAKLLGMKAVSLDRWLKRRAPRPGAAPSDQDEAQ